MGKLVAYSGFSASNYLEQPYNSDLDFGTGDFCIMGWFKGGDAGSNVRVMFNRRDSTAGIELYVNTSGQPFFRTRAGNADSNTTGSTIVDNNVWHHITAVRTNSGTILSLYVDGVLDVTSSVTARDIDGDFTTLLGQNFSKSTNFYNGSLALWRISATAPSPEQIARIYNDEKHLFTEGAQATLYGSSDSVTALAYDDSTELLHVGTSAGRSDFQGLRRVNNTTNAVGAAISASNGMIVEE